MRGLQPIAVLVSLFVLAGPAHAVFVGGGGSHATDCLLVFDADANWPADPDRTPTEIRCADGDPCDLVGAVTGRCQFAVSVCANSTFDARCTLNGVQSITVDHAEDNGDPRFDTEFQALQSRIDNGVDPPSTTSDTCTIATTMHVPVDGPLANGACRKTRKTIRITTLSIASGGKIYKDKDRFALTCEPAIAGCDARAFYSGTFDRIQRQIFTPSCAVSACHDSQTHQNDLILETGTSYGALIDVTPTNSAAAADGWKRVLPGDSSRSYLYHKVEGDLPSGAYGGRMPFGGPYLDQHLIDIIQFWIDAGAPSTGWVPGTDG
jgi:hypothetical protein